MTPGILEVEVRRLAPAVSGITIEGDLTSAGADRLDEAYLTASAGDVRVIALDFTHLGYMNSGGIGVLVALLLRAERDGRRLMAVGLGSHYREILALTRLDQRIALHVTEAEALADAAASAPEP
jgi:anti-sigma B factor antagonist